VKRAILLAAVVGCGNQTARMPSPARYEWPERMTYRVEYVSETQRDTVPLLRYVELKTLRLVLRDDRYLAWHDSVLKTSQAPGQPAVLEALWPEDTLQFHLKLGSRGEITDLVPGCDPALPACREALPSALPLELRRVVPRLPVWEAPRGAEWQDSLAYDDVPRPRGTRGYVITRYRAEGDTTIAGARYWVVRWRSVRHSFAPSGLRATIIAEAPVEETGLVMVDKERLIPAYASWIGAVAAPPPLRALGTTGTGFRGRAYLAGSPFDAMINPPGS
jgi:hypothetical protein